MTDFSISLGLRELSVLLKVSVKDRFDCTAQFASFFLVEKKKNFRYFCLFYRRTLFLLTVADVSLSACSCCRPCKVIYRK